MPGPWARAPSSCSRAAFEKVAYREGPDGFLAVVDRSAAVPRRPDARRLDPLVLVCQGVEKPGNLGAMLRTADAAGVAAVIAADPVTDWGNPNLVRASKGTVFSVPVASDSTEAALQWLRDHDIRWWPRPRTPTWTHTDVDYTGPVAVAVGAEKEGLTDEVARRRRRAGSASRWSAGSTRSTSPRRRRSSSTRRSASAVAADRRDGCGAAWSRVGVTVPRMATPSGEPRPPWHDDAPCEWTTSLCRRARRPEGHGERLAKQIGVDAGRWGGPPALRHPQHHPAARPRALRRGRRGAGPPRVDKAPFGQAVRARSEAGGGWLGWVGRSGRPVRGRAPPGP